MEKRDRNEAVMMRREKKHISERVVFMLKQRDNREDRERRKQSATRAQGFTNGEEAGVAGAGRGREGNRLERKGRLGLVAPYSHGVGCVSD